MDFFEIEGKFSHEHNKSRDAYSEQYGIYKVPVYYTAICKYAPNPGLIQF